MSSQASGEASKFPSADIAALSQVSRLLSFVPLSREPMLIGARGPIALRDAFPADFAVPAIGREL